ncbi:MAG: hypothetical protein IPJ68_00020 [Candidatus Moraniibacteriota bacterium]|nr:MAG: hypothetical protein IPJ68_00020 [Candidatus Moranbacteria bacterium]
MIYSSHYRPALVDFAYDDAKKMLIAAKNSKPATKRGMITIFITATISARCRARPVSSRDPGEFVPILNEMALDIANTDRSSDRYPFLRHFSPYAGHSWADGEALFQDGNNQESSSEALNAWYRPLALGSDRPRSLCYYGAESLRARTPRHPVILVWRRECFSVEYRHPIVSLVWGGKRDYATRFSADPMHNPGDTVAADDTGTDPTRPTPGP